MRRRVVVAARLLLLQELLRVVQIRGEIGVVPLELLREGLQLRHDQVLLAQPLELGRHLGTGLDLPLESSLELTYSLVRGGLGFCRMLPLIEELRLELRDPRLVAHALVIVQLALVLERGDVLERGR